MDTFANSEDPDEMPQNVAFHLGLHSLPRQNLSSEKEIFFFLNSNYDSSIYTMDHTDLTASKLMENSLLYKG